MVARILRLFTLSALLWLTSYLSALADSIGADSRFWMPPTKACEIYGDLKPLENEKTIYGFKYPSLWQRFINSLGLNIAHAINRDDFDIAGLAREITGLAENEAFTEMDFEGPGGPSPVFATSVTLINISYAVSLLDQKDAWPTGARDTVVAWGNRLNENQREKYSYSSPDSLAAIGAARVLWGAATQQPAVFSEGLVEFDKIMGMIGDDGLIEKNLRDNNEDIALLVLAAEGATQNGIQLYEKTYNGMTLHDAVTKHLGETLKHKDTKFKEGEAGDIARKYFRGSGYAAHVSWIPIYFSRFPDRPVAARMIEASRILPKKMRYGMSGWNVGGPTECLWGVVRD